MTTHEARKTGGDLIHSPTKRPSGKPKHFSKSTKTTTTPTAISGNWSESGDSGEFASDLVGRILILPPERRPSVAKLPRRGTLRSPPAGVRVAVRCALPGLFFQSQLTGPSFICHSRRSHSGVLTPLVGRLFS